MFIKIKDGQPDSWPYDPQSIITENPNTSFTVPLSKEVMEKYGVYELMMLPPPVINDASKKLEQKIPEFIDGRWQVQWGITDRVGADLEAVREGKSYEVLAQRNAKLSACDWTQLPDVELTSEQKQNWLTYRKSLRDITTQDGFPFNVQWPEQP